MLSGSTGLSGTAALGAAVGAAAAAATGGAATRRLLGRLARLAHQELWRLPRHRQGAWGWDGVSARHGAEWRKRDGARGW